MILKSRIVGLIFVGIPKFYTSIKTSYNSSQAIAKSEVLRFQFFFLRKSAFYVKFQVNFYF